MICCLKNNICSVLLMIALNLATGGVNAQKNDYRTEVMNSIRTRYPHAENVSLHNSDSYYQAKFALNGNKMSAAFTNSGDLIRTERDCRFKNLPVEVQNAFNKSRYAKNEKLNVREIRNTGEPVMYAITVATNHNNKCLKFDANGNMVKQADNEFEPH